MGKNGITKASVKKFNLQLKAANLRNSKYSFQTPMCKNKSTRNKGTMLLRAHHKPSLRRTDFNFKFLARFIFFIRY